MTRSNGKQLISKFIPVLVLAVSCLIANAQSPYPPRPEIDAYIAALPDTSGQRSALGQMSTSLRIAIQTDTSDRASMSAAANGIAAAAACLYARYDSSVAGTKRATIKKLSINTRARVAAYDKFNAALSGSTFALPQGDGCAATPVSAK